MFIVGRCLGAAVKVGFSFYKTAGGKQTPLLCVANLLRKNCPRPTVYVEIDSYIFTNGNRLFSRVAEGLASTRVTKVAVGNLTF